MQQTSILGQDPPERAESPVETSVPPAAPVATGGAPSPRETGGRDGPDPTRYGDWEKNGRCIDF